MGKVDFLQRVNTVISADADARGGPFSDTVDGEDQRLVEGRWIKGTSRVAPVMLGEQQLAVPVEARRPRLEPLAKQVLLKQFLLEPQWQSHAERGKTAGREGEIGLEQPFELQKRLLVEHDIVKLVEGQGAFLETIANRILRVARILFFAGKALLLRRGDNMAVLDQRRGTVMIKGGDPENAHAARPFSSKQRVNERRDRRALACDQQRAEQRHRYHYGGEPKFLANTQEIPEFDDKTAHLNSPQNCRLIVDAPPAGGSRSIQ